MPSVEKSLPCIRCRYSLRSVDAMGRCPECGLAVVTTLYGILAANLVLAPLARWVERAAEREERERQVVIDWLSEQVGGALPHGREGRGESRADQPRKVA